MQALFAIRRLFWIIWRWETLPPGPVRSGWALTHDGAKRAARMAAHRREPTVPGFHT
jgi:hypothetical protein